MILNKQKTLGLALVCLATSGLLASMNVGFVSGAVAETGTSSEDPETADTSSTVLTEEQCTWYMLGAPSSISLSAGFEKNGIGQDTTIPQEYAGQDLFVSSTLTSSTSVQPQAMSLDVYQSGNLTPGGADSTSECTFYGTKTAPRITFRVADADFVASYGGGIADGDLSFAASQSKPLEIALETSCNPDRWTVASRTDLFSTSLSGVGMEIGDITVVNKSVPNNAGERCKVVMNVGIMVPGTSAIPDGAGQTYTWTGPVLEIIRTTHSDTVNPDIDNVSS